MKIAGIIALSAGMLSQSPANSQVTAPWCGGVDRDIGRGFRVTQYMFDGSSDFTLNYQPPASAVHTTGVEMTAPFQLMFSSMNFGPIGYGYTGPPGPHIGFSNYEFRKGDGSRLGIGILKLECGNGVELNADYSSPSDKVKHPITFHTPFSGNPQQACLRELQQNQHYRFTAAEGVSSPLSVVIEGRIPLAWAIAKVQKLWKSDLQRAREGKCRLMPPPHSPF